MSRHCSFENIAIATIVFGSSCGALGADVSEPSTMIRPADGSALEEITVTAQRRAENLQTTPIAVTAFSDATLERHSVTALADLQEHVPSLTLRAAPQDGLSTVISIRGQSQQEIYQGKAPSVGLYYDGVYVASTAGTLGSNLLDVERIEVLRGPQGTLYGRNTTGGSINIISKLPSDQLEGSVAAETGNFGLYNVEGVLNVPLDGKTLDLRLVGQYFHHDGYGHNFTNGDQIGDEDSRSARVALRWRPTDGLDVIARGDYSYQFTHGEPGRISALVPGGLANLAAAGQLGVPFTAAGLAQASTTLFGLAPASPFDARDPLGINPASSLFASGASLTVSYALTPMLSIKSISSYRDSAKSIVQSPIGVPFVFVTYYPHPFTTDTFTYSQEFQLNGSFLEDRAKFVSGLYTDHSNGHEILDVDVIPAINPSNPLTLDDVFTDTSYAIYSQGTYDIIDPLSVTAGLRYTWC